MGSAILFYHPKNPQNLADIAALARHVGAALLIIRRPGSEAHKHVVYPNSLHVEVYESIEAYAAAVPQRQAVHIVLETYGSVRVDRLTGYCRHTGCVMVVGAEDYGIPLEEAEKLPGKRIYARLPAAVWGMSYNVASAVAMAVYELFVRKPTGESP